MNVTLCGRRSLRCWFGDCADSGHLDMGMAPWAVYFGTVAGPWHQVTHLSPRAPDETLSQHGLSVNLRACLFPLNRSRDMKVAPPPQPMFAALVGSFRDSLREDDWRLPSLPQCQAALVDLGTS